jgi:hypothetical protein
MFDEIFAVVYVDHTPLAVEPFAVGAPVALEPP